MPQKLIYFDHAAATPVDGRVIKAMQPYLGDKFFNPSATYLPAKQVRKDLEAARSLVAKWLGARPSEVIFTAGGSEANNLAIHGVMQRFPKANLVVSAIDHESVLAPAAQYNCRKLAVKPDGLVDLGELIKSIDGQTVLVSIGYANNEIGTIEPLAEINQALEIIRKQRLKEGNSLPLYFHSDACQAGNHLDLHVARLGVDLMTLNGGKIYGPKQSGALYVKAGVELQPLIWGGGQERGLRSGTENVAQTIGFATALDLAQSSREAETKRLKELQLIFLNLLSELIPSSVINGSLKHRLANNAHVTFPGIDNERLLLELEQKSILAAAGSACSASSEEPSHVLRAIGLSDEAARSSARFTLGRDTTEADIDYVIQTLKRLIVA
ncbi:MAG TPA: cysteine desulfurase family protein [Candidatus Saccharimonadales bacterium]|nr:cysteine desulfurase family protein [Candidatus Saccharimonadales bacterium]